MFATNAQSNRTSPLDRQITTPENQASAEFESINPLEQGLGGRFFGILLTGKAEFRLSTSHRPIVCSRSQVMGSQRCN